MENWQQEALTLLRGKRRVSITATEFSATQLPSLNPKAVSQKHMVGRQENSYHSDPAMVRHTLAASLELAKGIFQQDPAATVSLHIIINDFTLQTEHRKLSVRQQWPLHLAQVFPELKLTEHWRPARKTPHPVLRSKKMSGLTLHTHYERQLRNRVWKRLTQDIKEERLERDEDGIFYVHQGLKTHITRQETPICKTIMGQYFQDLAPADIIVNLYDQALWECGYQNGTLVYHQTSRCPASILNIGFLSPREPFSFTQKHPS